MIRLPLDKLLPGMIVGRPILDENGRVLLNAGQFLNERYIRRIKEMNIPMVCIDDQLGLEEPAPLIKPVTYLKATSVLKQSYQQFTKTTKTDLSLLSGQIDNIIDEMAENSNLMVGMSDLKSYDDYTYQHCVNVCALAIMIGLSSGLKRHQLQELGIGAILHDIGKVKIPLEILNKPGNLDDEEFEIIKHHPLDGFKMIRESTDNKSSSAWVALQHHERLDGTGYPRGSHGTDLHEYSLIVAAADVFDALVSNRPYRHAYNNLEAMYIIGLSKGSHLSPRFVDILNQHINTFPSGTVVVLSTGDTAVVSQENVKEFAKPQVRLLFNSMNQAYKNDHMVDLAVCSNIHITKICNTKEAVEIICRYFSHGMGADKTVV